MSPLTVQKPIQVTDTRSGLGGGLRRFRPRLALGYQRELQALAARISGKTIAVTTDVISKILEDVDARHRELTALGLDATDLLPTLQWSTALRVLRDLSSQGWSFGLDDEGVLLSPPGTGRVAGEDPEREKEAIRRSFSFARNAQLNEPSTERFIRTMERRGIDRLFADGGDVAARLRAEGAAGIQPELEFFERGAKDAETGLALQDVWRYARLFWSIPYQSTPGRNMFFLVRDSGAPGRPLIGIAALGNPVLGLSQRDEFAGWNANGLRAKLGSLDSAQRKDLVRRLYDTVEAGLQETYSADIWPDGPPQAEPSEFQLLARIEQDSSDERLRDIGTHGDARGPEYRLIRAAHTAVQKGHAADVDWEAVARTNLYRRKRAAALADLLRARSVLQRFGLPQDTEGIENALLDEDGVRAVEVGLRRIKQGVIASSVMEIITCGAVPPYRDALGGKLVALMMLSREVVDAYQQKYASQVSLIASALAGTPVRRPTQLALLTTSSLFAIGSSQYNRLRVPCGDAAVAYKRIGTTDSFGTVHFAPDTVGGLNKVARLVDLNRRTVNNLFGEGTSPKLRLIRAGLEGLGLNAEVFLRHHSPRLLYAAALCKNIDEVLLGADSEPDYVLPDGKASTALLVEHWRDRWLAPRLDRPEILERFSEERRHEFLLGGGLASSGEGAAGRRAPSVMPGDGSPVAAANPGQTFVERLYRSAHSYADRLSQDELDAIHVDLGVDGFLLEEASKKKQIVVTGNPGDGKTHLIERLRPQLEAEGAEVITDANAVSDEETLATWQRCRKKGKPFVLAINEWPLYVLQRLAQDKKFTPVAEALRQVRAARFFVDSQKPEPPQEDVVTIDLSLRDLLAPSVIEKVIERLTDEQFYEGLNEADPMRLNRLSLQQPQVQERLAKALHLVAVRLGHVTMRQLVGFIAFLLSGGQSAAERLKAGQDAVGLSYSNLAFEGGEGELFETLRRVFDPAAMTHPTWDDRLWRGDVESSDWNDGAPAPVLSLPESEREAAFRATKRRFFFEHAKGGCLLDLQPNDEEEFERTLEEGGSGKPALVRGLILAVNRFYEPDFPEKDQDRLLLWQSHRYDVRAPAAFISLRELPHQNLRVEPLRYATWVERWLPPEQQSRRSFALVALSSGEDAALLEIDRELYLTLLEAQSGLGRSSWSRTATRRITRFVDRIDRKLEQSSGVEDLRVRNVDNDLDERFAVQRTPARYQL